MGTLGLVGYPCLALRGGGGGYNRFVAAVEFRGRLGVIIAKYQDGRAFLYEPREEEITAVIVNT